MEFDDTVLHKIWEVEIDILQQIHDVCYAHNLRYSIAYGTILGAVRHKGFIPWDDDIDIMMPREDYNILLENWNVWASKEYILQDCHKIPGTMINFSKIRKDHTCFLQFELEKPRLYHKGIFIDIFPYDRMPASVLKQKLQKIAIMLNLLYSRGYCSKSTGIRSVGEKLLLAVGEKHYLPLANIAERIATMWNSDTNSMYFSFGTMNNVKFRFSSRLFDDLVEIDFENRKFNVVSDWKKCLEAWYGNYMQLPPEEERVWRHHPLIVDFERNYEEL